MSIREKIAYIKGLAEGLKLDENKDEVKVLNAVIEMLDEMSDMVCETKDTLDGLAYSVEAIDDELSELEEAVYDEDDEECCHGHHEGHHHHHHHHHCCDDEFDFDDCDCGCDDEDIFYEVTCPTCGAEINVAEDVLLCGETSCPKCGEILEFDFSSLGEDDDDECDCCSSDNEHNEEEE